MCKIKKRTQKHNSAKLDQQREYETLELKQVIDRIFSLEKTRFDLGAFLGTACLTALVAGIQFQYLALLVISLVLLIILWIFETKARNQHLIYYYRGLYLQRKLSGNKRDGFLEYHTSEHAKEAKRILELDEKDRVNAIKESNVILKGVFFYLLFFLIICEIVVIGYVIIVEQWPLFAK